MNDFINQSVQVTKNEFVRISKELGLFHCVFWLCDDDVGESIKKTVVKSNINEI